jgi:hypothetical protein
MLNNKEVKRLRKGEAIQGAWRIEGFNDVMAELTLIEYSIKKQIPIQDKGRP